MLELLNWEPFPKTPKPVQKEMTTISALELIKYPHVVVDDIPHLIPSFTTIAFV